MNPETNTLPKQPYPVRFTAGLVDEMTTLLRHLGYSMEKAGKTGGARVAFANRDGDYIRLHKPHPRNILKLYQIDDIVTSLAEKGLL